ncbi:diuretic hormone receptor-like isoform X1 [Diabrotica undecimpunctata]|uniref:diuretic hormone receptor-like isoform X1 n=1 Tax=Diabrotica undecimpunctata TaxID=50387 RepID=UPI003B636DB7
MNWEQDLSPLDHDTPNTYERTMYEDYDYDSGINKTVTIDDCKEEFSNQTQYLQQNYPDDFCKVAFDSLVCWPPTRKNEVATIQCFAELFEVKYDTTQNATRLCTENGTWAKQNFSMCKELLLEKVEMQEDTTQTIFFVGFIISLITLTIAVAIFMYFKDLHCLRNKIHINLMWSYILMYCSWIMMLILINYKSEILFCGFGTMLLHYSHVSTFFWMFVEGMYLYILVVKTLRHDTFKLRIYVSIGWGAPLIIVILWAVIKGLVTVKDSNCFWLQNDLLDWIYLSPPLLVICLNLVFLVQIMWVLITKLRSSPTVEHKQHYKAARALLVLMPLLGVTWAVTIYVPAGTINTKLFEYIQTVLLSTQGLMIALFYCFLNTEVQNSIKHNFNLWKDRRSLGSHRFWSNSAHHHRRHTEWTLVNADDIEHPPANETQITNHVDGNQTDKTNNIQTTRFGSI